MTNALPTTADLTDELEFDDLVKELDALLDAWFLGEAPPAPLDELSGQREAA